MAFLLCASVFPGIESRPQSFSGIPLCNEITVQCKSTCSWKKHWVKKSGETDKTICFLFRFSFIFLPIPTYNNHHDNHHDSCTSTLELKRPNSTNSWTALQHPYSYRTHKLDRFKPSPFKSASNTFVCLQP